MTPAIFSIIALTMLITSAVIMVVWIRWGTATTGITLGQDLPQLPTCGGCGYAVRGVSELACPECGADLREVGIFPSGFRRRSSAGMLVLWSLAMLILSAILVPLATHTLAPIRIASSVQTQLTLNATSGKDIHAMLSAQTQQVLMPWNNQPAPASFTHAQLELQSTNGVLTAKLDQPQGQWQIRTPGASSSVRLNAASLGQWIAGQSGLDPALSDAWAGEIVQEIRNLSWLIHRNTWQGRSTSGSSSRSNARSKPLSSGGKKVTIHNSNKSVTTANVYPGFKLGFILIAIITWGVGVKRIVTGALKAGQQSAPTKT